MIYIFLFLQLLVELLLLLLLLKIFIVYLSFYCNVNATCRRASQLNKALYRIG